MVAVILCFGWALCGQAGIAGWRKVGTILHKEITQNLLKISANCYQDLSNFNAVTLSATYLWESSKIDLNIYEQSEILTKCKWNIFILEYHIGIIKY